ncbi:SDR family oxidoreductase [Histidinibacterium aquaticum]|uniref:SDR family oxidoreductase n=1 Tax=Histidinibacterium aquaticum TaxID=2613962 RepID=A0A5J5GM06_9RHOB|nr:SDR family oxidoreductase [Histidinibacterium aquaticum]KAA9009077.1 SDR family oxidoreductase [Histidinibacterium aquaticum]
MSIAVTGSTGHLGRRVIAGLKGATDTPIVALARDPAKGADLGVEVRAFDYDSSGTLAPALEGVETLLLISGSELGERSRQHRAVIEAAKEAGVGRVVYTSVLHAPTSTLALAPEHRETEAALAESGLAHTLLRNGWYTENYAPAVSTAMEHGAVFGAAGRGRISSATRDDFAAAAVAALTRPETEGQVFELAGDESWTMDDLAAELTRQTQREIPYRDMSVEEYAGLLQQSGMPEGMAGMIAGMDAEIARGVLHDDSGDLSRLIGRPTTRLSDWVAAQLS